VDNVVIYQNDHLGTPQKLTAVNGAVVWSAKYSSFGEADVNISSSITNNLRFPGQYFDQETNLYYNLFRYYDPAAGRYLRPDPIGMRGGINLFIYALNNPKNYIDPLGLLVPPKCMNECCNNCEQKEVIRDKRTGETRTREEYYWDEIARVYALSAWTAFAAWVGIPTPPPTYHDHLIGKRYYEEKWIQERCIREICKDFMTYPIYSCQDIDGSEYWAEDLHQKPEEIIQTYFY
jgi:RHS repeat-associated protein